MSDLNSSSVFLSKLLACSFNGCYIIPIWWLLGVTTKFWTLCQERLLFLSKGNARKIDCPLIYSYSCGKIDCNEEYIGESGRTFGEKFMDYLKAPSTIFIHQSSSGHETSMENFKIIGREDNSLARTIKESILKLVGILWNRTSG